MSNVIKIKRGSGTPTTSNLAQYELAYDHAANKLYIHDPTNSSGQEIVEITGSTITTAAVSNGATTLATGNAIYDHVTSRISGLTSNTGTVDTSGTPSAQEYARFTDANTVEGRSAAGVRTDLGLNIGTNVQAYDTLLQDIADFSTSNAGNNGKVVTYQDSSGSLVLSTPSAGTITGVTGMTDNNVLTASGSTTISGESSLQFAGQFLSIQGNDPSNTYGVKEKLRIHRNGTNTDRQLQIYEMRHSGGREFLQAFNLDITTDNSSGYTYTQGLYGGSSYIEFDNAGALKFYNDTGVSNASRDAITPSLSMWISGDNNIVMPGRLGIGWSSGLPARALDVKGGIELSADDDTIDTNNFTLRRGSSGVGHLDSPGNIRLNIDSNNNQTNAFFEICANASTTPVFKVGETGIVTTGTWNGTTIASAYLDADTAHLSGTQTFSGAKTFSSHAEFDSTINVDSILYGNNIDLTGELNFTGNGNKIVDVFTLENSNTFRIRHHNPLGNVFHDGLVLTGNAGAKLYYNNGLKFQTTNTGATVTGNIAVTGTVDGRDVASDGSKLDGIASGATANVGDITGITTTANSGLTGGTTSGTASLVVDHLRATDDRDVKPSDITTSTKAQVRAYFTSLEGLTGTAGSDWQDLLVFDTYTDGTGGDMNALAFDKSTHNIYHYLADQSDSTWGTAKRLAYIENGSNNRVMTASSSSTVNGEGNLTFDGTDLFVAHSSGSAIFAAAHAYDKIKLFGSSGHEQIGTEGSTIVLTASNFKFRDYSSGATRFLVNSSGNVTTGVWQGTAIANAYVADLPASKITSGELATARVNWDSTDKTVRWDSGRGYHGNPRSVAIGYSGGNYGQFGYGINFTTTSNQHTYAFNDIASRCDLYDGLQVYTSVSGGTAGSAISWTELLRVRNGAFNYKGNAIWHAGNDGSGSGLDADLLDGLNNSAFPRRGNLAENTASSITTFNSNAAIDTTTGNQSGLQVYQDTVGEDAFMTFHVANDYALYFGLDGGTNDLAVGGWSKGASSYKIWHAGNDGTGSGLDADTLDGLQLETSGRNDNADKVVRTNSNGYLMTGWINTPSGNTTTASSDYYVNTNDGYIRKKTLANVRTEIMGVSSGSSFLRSDADDTASGQYSFTKVNDHAIKVGTIRGTVVGSQGGEYIQMYNRVNIGSPSGWGSRSAPNYGLSVYGGVDLCTDTGDVQVGGNLKLTRAKGLLWDYAPNTGHGGYIAHPGGGMYRTSTGTHTGALAITLPSGGGPADMLSFWVDVFDYTSYSSQSFYIAGYVYQTAGSNEWVNETALMLTPKEGHARTVRFGHDGTNHVVYIGELTDTWAYPQVTVRNVQVGFNSDVDTYNDNWSISFQASAFANVDATYSGADTLPTAGKIKMKDGAGKFVHNTTSSRDKLRVWNSGNYAIGMQHSFNYGGLTNQYAMTFNMDNTTHRGFWWGKDAHGQSQGAMALTNEGKLTVAHSMRLGYGESDTTTPGGVAGLDVNSNIYIRNTGTAPFALGEKTNTLRIKGNGNSAFNFLNSGNGWANLYFNRAYANDYFQANNNGSLLRLNKSSWTNAPDHDIIYNAYQTTLGDYTYLKSAGNSTTTQGMLLNSDNYLFWGRDNLTTGAVDNSATAPMTDVCMRVDASGNALFDGDVVAYSSTIASDARLKENVKDLNYGLKDVLNMRAVSFDWIDKRNGQHDIGVIAQEIEKIIPEVVVEVDTLNSDKDTHKTVDYGKLTSVLITAIQEQQVQIDELKTKLGE